MIQEIKYSGLTSIPADNVSKDGDTSLLLNIASEDGALKPVLPPKSIMALGAEQRVVYIHNTYLQKRYIIHHTDINKISWTENGETFVDIQSIGDKELHQVLAIGNTLIVFTTKGMCYFLWKNDQQSYSYLGEEIPELPISFGLQGEMIRGDEFNVRFQEVRHDIKYKSDGSGTYISWHEFSEEDKKTVSEQVLAKVNKFINDNSTNKGKFIYPFFVRYAFRLYDGSLVKHSAPILMICSTSCAPMVFYRSVFGDNKNDTATVRVVGLVHTLDYAVCRQSELDKLKEWGDIVKSVDVFISQPIYTYDQNGLCDRLYNYDEYSDKLWGYSVCKHINQSKELALSKYPLRYQAKDINYLYQATFDPTRLNFRHGGILGLPRKSSDVVKEDIRNCSQFYFLEAIKLEHLSIERTLLSVKEDYLKSLVAREVMTDDYDSHDKIIPRYAFPYNGRINIANIKKRLFDGFDAGSMFCYTDGYVMHSSDESSIRIFDSKISVTTYIYIKQDGKDIVVQGPTGVLGMKTKHLFMYYPNPNAYKAVVEDFIYASGTFYEVPLERHAFLNGAFFFGGWDDLSENAPADNRILISSDKTIEMPNKIYTSEINNPFYFPLSGINSVGTGHIVGISSAVKALSEGQFGQFPLYAFTTDGVWALEVSNTGTYTARQPVSRDVCDNPKSITQIDNAVLFSTDRGIILLQGSQTTCISDVLSGNNTTPISVLPKMDLLLNSAGFQQSNVEIVPFMTFLSSCQMVYDYKHQRIIVYNSKYNYAYIFSMKSKQWGMMQSDIVDNVNSYPDAIATSKSGKLVNFSDKGDGVYKNIIVSRPIKIGDENIYKTIDTIIQRGFFREGNVKSVLYASNDTFNWILVWSSQNRYLRGFKGTPYKYYRIALVSELSDDEAITGCTIQFTTKITNRPR